MFLKNFDMISDLNCIYYKGAKQHISNIGGFLTILVYVTVMFFAGYFSIDTVLKYNPTSYFYKKFIPDAGIYYLNSSMFHYVELLDPDDNVIMDERSWMIFGTESYIDEFLGNFKVNEISHWNYGLCNSNDALEFKDINEDIQYLKAWCARGYWDSHKKRYYTPKDKEYIPPFVAYGTGSKKMKNIGYGFYVAKCQNTTFRNNCKSLHEINNEFKKLLRIKVSIIDNNFDVTLYKTPIVPYFLDVKNHLTGETITMNNLNFNPVVIQTNDGFVFNSNKITKSYILDFNEKLTYNRGNTTLLSGWYILITNLCETYTRTYPKIQEALANVGGALKAILLIAQILNFLFNQWKIVLDIQYECEKLGLEYSFFENDNINTHNKNLVLNKEKFELSISGKNSKNNCNINGYKFNRHGSNKSSSEIPLSNDKFSNISNNYIENKFKQVNNNANNKNVNNLNINNNLINSSVESNKESIKEINIENKNDLNNSIIESNLKQETQRDNNKNNYKKNNRIKFSSYVKSLFLNKIKVNKSSIKLMQKFWINKISEENIVQMDLKLYKLLNQSIKKGASTHLNNLLDDIKDKKMINVEYKNTNL